MSYCVLDDIKELNPKQNYTSTSKPSTFQVEGYIDDIALDIDNALRAIGYTLPVTDATDLLTLKKLNALGAAAQADWAMFPAKDGPGSSGSGRYIWNA